MQIIPRYHFKKLSLLVAEILQQIRDAPGITSLKLSGNSYGTEAASAIGKLLEEVGGSLRHALWSDMFVSRLKTEIPPALVSRSCTCTFHTFSYPILVVARERPDCRRGSSCRT